MAFTNGDVLDAAALNAVIDEKLDNINPIGSGSLNFGTNNVVSKDNIAIGVNNTVSGGRFSIGIGSKVNSTGNFDWRTNNRWR